MKGYGEHTTARLDVTYMCSKNGQPNTNPMDICSDSGMAILGLNHYSQKSYVPCVFQIVARKHEIRISNILSWGLFYTFIG